MEPESGRLPRHIAIIMDGNGRWAKRRGHPRVFGHVRGASRVHEIVEEAGQLGINVLTLYAFSTENWSRPSTEITVLWSLLKRYLKRETRNLKRQNVRLAVLGEMELLPPDVQLALKNATDTLRDNTGLQLNLALSYGARQEIVRASRALAEKVKAGVLSLDQITEQTFENSLGTSFLGPQADVDLLIRTSGEVRVSNFLLWQIAYSEMIFLELAWPEFTRNTLKECVEQYKKRTRRFGKISHAATV
jgi:undecaprenyl diphosphate synthase